MGLRMWSIRRRCWPVGEESVHLVSRQRFSGPRSYAYQRRGYRRNTKHDGNFRLRCSGGRCQRPHTERNQIVQYYHFAAGLHRYDVTVQWGYECGLFGDAVGQWGEESVHLVSRAAVLAPGLTLTSGGVIDGTPSTTGTFDFVAQVVDASGLILSATKSFSITILQPVSIATTSLSNGVTNVVYSATLLASGGKSPYTWSVASGSLPPGFTLTSGGVIGGTPSTTGTFDFVAQVVDASGLILSATKSLSITILQPVVITTASLSNRVVNVAYTATLTASGGTTPYTWSIPSGTLPSGLTLNSNSGIISGTPTATGTFSFVAQVSDAGSPVETTTKPLSITIQPSLAITTTSLFDRVVNVAYTATLTASGGTTPYTWSISSGTLPSGLTLNSNSGIISGTPTATGTFSFVAQVSDAGSPVETTTKPLSITIQPSLAITTTSLFDRVVNVAYTATLTASGGTTPYTWSIPSGTLPSGLTLNSNSGIISGTPTATGTFSFVAQVSDAGSPVETTTKPLSITIQPSLAITTTSLFDRVVNVAYTATLTASGGTTPYTWSIPSGTLPSGLTLNSNSGIISGTPTATGTFSFVAQVSDAGSPVETTTKPLSITIQPSLAITTTSLFDRVVNVAYTATLTASGGTTPYTWSIPSGTLPSGLTLNSNSGIISGTPTATGTFSFVAQVSDAGSPVETTTKPLSITIQPSLAITTTSLFDRVVNVAYTATLTASGGTTPYTWSIPSGTLPSGLTLNSNSGIISGTPTATGTFSFVAQVSDAGSPVETTTKPLSITIQPSLAITTTSLFDRVVNVAYTATLTASGGTTPYTWSISSGTLPSGLTLNSNSGIISGTPTATGTFSFVAQVSDAGSPVETTTKPLSITIQPSLAITTTSLFDRVVNVAYTATLTASGGTTPYTWSIPSGTLPSGLTLNSNSGIISGTPTATGTFSFVAQVSDAGSPIETTTKPLSITIISVPLVTTIWPSNAMPGHMDDGPDSAVELGVKFRSDMAGTITGIRFYKAAANTGTHVGNLWSSTGAPLATAIFSNETASGWQQAFFATPVTIASNTVYVASYHANSGHYSADLNYFLTGVDNPPLHALANGVSGGNGVFAYGASSAFPNQDWYAANYWVDVVFRAGPPPTLTSIAVMPENPSIIPGASQQFTATGTYSDGSTQNLTSQATWISSNALVATINAGGLATGVTAGTTTISASLTGVTGNTMLTIQSVSLAVTTASLSNGVVNATYTATLTANGGTLPYTWSIIDGSLPSGLTLNSSSGAITGIPSATGSVSFTAQVMDAGSPAQTVTKSLSITIVSVPLVTIWPSTTVPSLVDGGPDSAVELGVKFRSDVAGTITGIRFYKATANTGTHIGNLWTSTGTPLATAIFSNETASGWQQVFFATPVAIASNTVYVASYHANSGHYSADRQLLPGKRSGQSAPARAGQWRVWRQRCVCLRGEQCLPQPDLQCRQLLGRCGVPGGPREPTSIVVTPATTSILARATQQFTATGTYSDGSRRDITSLVTWISSDTRVATINAAGLASALSAGTTSISAVLAAVTGSAI